MKEVLSYLQELIDQNVSVEDLKELLKKNTGKTQEKADQPKQEVVQSSPQQPTKKLFRIVVKSSDGDIVNIAIPLQLARYAMALKPQFITKHTEAHNIDVDTVIDMLEGNLSGDFINIESGDGDTVRIFVE